MAISLSAGVRQSLQSLTSTAAAAQVAQNRLATGKRVNSAIDNPVNFFTAASLNNRADQFSGLLDGISNSIQTIKAASNGIDGITKLVKSLQSTIKQAQSDAVANRAALDAGAALATDSEAALRGVDLRTAALDKGIYDNNGATANATTATYAGNNGVTSNTVNMLAVSVGDKTFTTQLASTATVRDAVNAINGSGIATADIDVQGRLQVKANGSGTLKVGLGSDTTVGAALTAANSGTGNVAGLGLQVGDASTGEVAVASSNVRASLVKQFNDARTQLDQLAKDSGYNGTNLLAGDKLKVVFNEKTGNQQSKLDVDGQKLSADSLGLVEAGTAALDFQDDADLATAADALTTSLTTLQTLSSTLGSSLSVVQTRQDFSKSLIDTLKIGADNLVNADSNEEGANLLALQTRQQLSQTALSLSSQADQAVLRLF